MLLQCSWVALVFVLVLVLVLEQTRTATANADKQTRPTTFSKTCPEDASPNCHPGNKCTKCHPTCKYCQNLSNDTCDVSDCMVCKDDLFLITKYSDGTGQCVPEEVAFKPTCPIENKLCLPGNKCTTCPPRCRYCWSQTADMCFAVDCLECEPGFVHHRGLVDIRGSCHSPARGYKPTCPKSFAGCSTKNQCLKCSLGCDYCQDYGVAQCASTKCLRCSTGFEFVPVQTEAGATYGECVLQQFHQQWQQSHPQQATPQTHRKAKATSNWAVLDIVLQTVTVFLVSFVEFISLLSHTLHSYSLLTYVKDTLQP
eukprot:m.20793 g.20793  ORF g.20793 m.20793 type:complete len:312 (+) comp8205_c0_seq1:86-1021(+)